MARISNKEFGIVVNSDYADFLCQKKQAAAESDCFRLSKNPVFCRDEQAVKKGLDRVKVSSCGWALYKRYAACRGLEIFPVSDFIDSLKQPLSAAA